MRWTLGFSSLIPHQLRTPIAVMRSQLENAMQEHATRTQLQSAMASTYDEILKLSDSIEVLLTLTKLQAGTLHLELQKLRIRNFLEGFREEACGLVQHKNIEFVLEEGPDVLLTADLQWIRHALFNLLDNAIRHTAQGGQISVRYAVTGTMLDLQLSDSGKGIPPAKIPHLFEPFYQGEYRDRNAPGTGLGLVLVKLIVTAHSGTVHVTSVPGQGTTFTMSLPLKQESGQQESDALAD
jgi:two-component system sensor histidine kinase ResE